MRDEIQQAVEMFTERFGASRDEVRIFFAPGRVNLIGEHIDYNGGNVLPGALGLGIWMVCRSRQDHRYRFSSTLFAGVVDIKEADLLYREADGYANYPKGVISLLRDRGIETSGLDCFFHSTLPSGSGLSSSAAIELVTAYGVTCMADAAISKIELAQLAQVAENQYLGVQCGIMDQFAVALGQRNHAILLNCDTLAYEYVPVALGQYALVIMDSCKPRALVDSLYNERRRECLEALTELQHRLPHLHNLTDLTYQKWEQMRSLLHDRTLRKRVDHVVSENARVNQAVDRLRVGDILGFGALLTESHRSLAKDYEVTGPELDALVQAAHDAPGCVGSRMTGAGFGGCAIAVVENASVDHFFEAVRQQYAAQIGYAPQFYASQLGDGVREWPRF